LPQEIPFIGLEAIICLFVRISEALVFWLSFLTFRNLIEVFLNLIGNKWWLLMATLVTIDNENNDVLYMWILPILWVLLVHILAMLFHFLKPKL